MNTIGAVLNVAFGLVLLWIVVYFGWRPYRIDNLRQRLFELRDELFLAAADGELSFDDSAYQILRDRLNAVIRFAHTVTLTRSVLYRLEGTDVEGLREKWLQAVAKLSDKQRQHLLDIDQRASFVLVDQVFSGSPIMWVALACCIPVFVWQEAKEAKVKAAKQLRVEQIEAQAVIKFKREQGATESSAHLVRA